MVSCNGSRLPALAFALVALLLIGFTNANPVQYRRALTSAAPSIDNLTLTDSLTLTAKSVSSPSPLTLTATEAAPIPTDNGRIAASAASSPLEVFCKAFVEQCYKIALGGQTGEVTVSHSCERDGGKNSTTFTYSCYRGTTKLTAKVLKAMGQEYHTPSTSTVRRMTLVTNVVAKVSTRYSGTTSTTTTRTVATVTGTVSTISTRVVPTTVPSTAYSTSTLRYTRSLTTTAPTTRTITRTTTVRTGTATEVFIGTAEIPIYQVVARDVQDVQRRAPSTFCLAFRVACENECARVSSRVDTEICDASESPKYSMACICKNGIRETQHALEAIAEDQKIVNVTTIGTSTTFVTTSRTTTVPTRVITTQPVTRTNLKTVVTRTATSLSTKILTRSAVTTATRTVSTKRTTVLTTRTSTVVSTTRVPVTTTRIVLAATGFVHALDSVAGETLGSLGYLDGLTTAALYPGGGVNAVECMAIRSSPSGLYQLAQVGNPTNVFYQGETDSNPVFQGGSAAAAPLQFGPASTCGANADAPGPYTSSSPCQTFMFSPIALDPSRGATPNTVNLRPLWINPTGIVPGNWTGAWGVPSNEEVLVVADPPIYNNQNPDNVPTYFTLRFPFASA